MEMWWEPAQVNTSGATEVPVVTTTGGIPGPGVRWGHTCNAVDNGRFLYVFGGYGGNKCQTNDVHVFDTVKQVWSKPVFEGISPSPRDSHSCTTVGDKLFVFGGTDGKNLFKDVHILDTTSNTWIMPELLGKGPDAREGHSAVLVGKRIFIFGGCGKSDTDEAQYYNDVYILDTENLSWHHASTSGTPPSARDSHSCSLWKNKIIVLGGEDSSDCYLSDVHILDTDTLVWEPMKTSGQILPPRAGHTTVTLGSRLFVFGGFTDASDLYDDLHVLNIGKERDSDGYADSYIWTRVRPLNKGPCARFSVAGDCLDERRGILVFVGGCNKFLEALDDMYFLHTGTNIHHPMPAGKIKFEARVMNANQYGYEIETEIKGKLMHGMLFSCTSSLATEDHVYPNKRMATGRVVTGRSVVDKINDTTATAIHGTEVSDQGKSDGLNAMSIQAIDSNLTILAPDGNNAR